MLAVAGYAALAVALSWPLAAHLTTALPGYPNVDAMDTLTLRGLVAQMLRHPGDWPWSEGVYFPAGYPVGQLTPNLLDHALGAPFALSLPFPLGDNLWWLAVMTANGLAGHHLGRQLGGSHGAGALMGVGWACADPLLRELNLLHAPQSLMPWTPLYLGALMRALGDQGRLRDGAMAGLWMGLSGLTYWYQVLFLAFGTAPLAAWRLWRRPAAAKPFGVAVLTATLVAAPLLIPMLRGWEALPLADPAFAPAPLDMRAALEPIPEGLRFVVEQSAPLGFPFQSGPLDRSNRVSLVLLAAAGVVLWRRRPEGWGAIVAMAGVGAVFALGPYLKLGEDPLLLGGRPLALPFRWLGALHPFLERLTWPQRWGMLIPLGLGALACRAPRPWLWVPAVVLEALLLSGNAPLQTQDVRDLEPWRVLSAASGAVIELPLAREGLDAPLVGLHARYHRRPMVNPMLLPPGAALPEGWRDWVAAQPLMVYLQSFEEGRYPPDPGPDAVRTMQEAGVAAIALDALPGSVITEGVVNRYVTGLGRHLGPPQDHGALFVWWLQPPTRAVTPLSDGAAWREAVHRRRVLNPPAPLDTLIEPLDDRR
ncbi:MAG: hypothetical protein H6739_03700 [Alphaproteobacteria bacterium]|nr:hypothetical protein [Alphaproteobacteria bacterium]